MENPLGLPEHIAFIMDGNGRWAEQRGLSRLEGHRAGVTQARLVAKALAKRGIRYATLYAFSTENWRRPVAEVAGLFRILDDVIAQEARELHRYGVRIRHLGDLEGLSARTRRAIDRALALTRENTGTTLCVALNYGGRGEILRAVRRLLADGLAPEAVDEAALGKRLDTSGLPDVDLVVRTGGEFRVSNFMLWQTAYSEFYFTSTLWPDFGEEELEKVLAEYRSRQRRFGGLAPDGSGEKTAAPPVRGNE
ncbi:MAG: polyprenyl diphosphate synthase [Chloroflexota bacterium]